MDCVCWSDVLFCFFICLLLHRTDDVSYSEVSLTCFERRAKTLEGHENNKYLT